MFSATRGPVLLLNKKRRKGVQLLSSSGQTILLTEESNYTWIAPQREGDGECRISIIVMEKIECAVPRRVSISHVGVGLGLGFRGNWEQSKPKSSKQLHFVSRRLPEGWSSLAPLRWALLIHLRMIMFPCQSNQPLRRRSLSRAFSTSHPIGWRGFHPAFDWLCVDRGSKCRFAMPQNGYLLSWQKMLPNCFAKLATSSEIWQKSYSSFDTDYEA